MRFDLLVVCMWLFAEGLQLFLAKDLREIGLSQAQSRDPIMM